MNIEQTIQQTQSRADQLAIKETHLREQIAPLQAQLDQVIRAKHQALGALEALKAMAQRPAQPPPTEPLAPQVERKAKGR